ncbi:E3 ubiquitin-protein ligase MARCHF5 [Anabrus simplex]|uniref:E3 ubiquitin-protein ligase MARCHF5 n=1 Tax=Anabrus simplex TaxID=316456 RepID=UPI0034DDB69B
MAEEDTDKSQSSEVSVTAEDDGASQAVALSEESKRTCWVCFATDEDDAAAEWVQPCNCRGTTKWVHQSCIQRWVDEKQKGNATGRVACPQCNTPYTIVFPHMGTLVMILDTFDNVIYKVCPFMAAGIVVGSIYWTAVTYGAVTVMQVVGHKEGMTVMEQAEPLVLLIGLPTIPIMLILGKMVHWEDTLLNFLRRHSYKVPLLRHILPASAMEERRSSTLEFPPMADPVSATRVLCGALLLPTVATLFGKLFFDSVQSNLHRALLGGVAFITIKGTLKIYHKQQQYIRQRQRRILDFNPENQGAANSPSNRNTAHTGPVHEQSGQQ